MRSPKVPNLEILTLDLKSGYWQVEVEEQDREKTAFTAGNGLWQFERLMDNILGDLR